MDFVKVCQQKDCGKEFTTTAHNAKYCSECRAEVDRERSRKWQDRYREKGTDHKERHAELSKKEAVEFLSVAGIKPAFVREMIYELAILAARAQDVPAEKKFYKCLVAIKDLEIPGELVTLRTLFALWQTSALCYEQSWRFNEFLSWRKACKKDAVLLGKLLGKNFQKEPHGDWADFLPGFDPDGLKPNYSQEDMRFWLRSQASKMEGSKRDYLLMCARNHYKSTFATIWAVTAILCCPDIRVLLCSKIQPVAKDFMDAFRAYWEIGSGPQNEAFQSLFPEYMVKAGEGKAVSFESPMSHLNLPQKSAQLTSVDSGSTGTRFDILIADDVVDPDNSENEIQRKKVIRRYDALWKLREVGGITVTIGTPQHPEDLYAESLKRAEKGQELAIHLSPAWTVINPDVTRNMALPKGHPEYFDIHRMKFEDIVLLFPLRNFTAADTFTWLMTELGKTPDQERDFRCQYLIQWISDEKEEVLNFDENRLRAAVIQKQVVPEGDTILFLDTAYSQSRYADNSALSAIRLAKNTGGDWSLYVLDQDSGHWRAEEKATKTAKFWWTYQPKMVVAEKPSDYEYLADKIRYESMRQNIPGGIQVFWIPVDNSKNAKFNRVKSCEVLLPERLKFVSGQYTEDLFAEARRLDGKTSSMTSRNDRWDSISLAVRLWKTILTQFRPSSEADLQKVKDKQANEAWMKMEYDLHFARPAPSQPPLPMPAEIEHVDTRRGPLIDAGKKILGPGFRV